MENTIMKNLKTVIFIAIIVMIVCFGLSFLQTEKYESSAKMIVVLTQENVDSYAASRTASYVAGVLGEIVHSNSFMDSVFKSNFSLRDDLGLTAEKRLKNWKKMVEIKTKENQGIIFISVLNKDREQANQFAQAISYTLTTKHGAYHGLGDKVAIKIIDNPTVAEKPTQPKIIVNTALGLILGLILGLTFVIIFPEQQLLAALFSKSNKIGADETIELAKPGAVKKADGQPEEPAAWSDYEKSIFPESENQTGPTDQNQNEPKQNNYYGW